MNKLILLVSVICSSATWSIDQALVSKLQANAQIRIDNHMASGVAVGLIDGDEIESFALGYADIENKKSLTLNHYFSIGSVSKTFTSLLLSKAVTEGVVNIEDQAKTYVPELSGHKVGELNLKDLSTHNSLLQRDPIELSPAGVLQPFENYSQEQLLKELINASYYTDSSIINYSNLGVSLLGLVLERAYGAPFEELLEFKIYMPLKLDEIITTSKEGDVLLPKKYSSALREVPVWQNLGSMNAAGSIKATIPTMINYIRAQLNPAGTKLQKTIENSQKVLNSYKDMNMAYGWFVFDRPYGKLFWHNGSTAGFFTNVYFSKELNKGIIVVSNTDHDFSCMAAIFLTGNECQVKVPIVEEYESLKEFAGIYSAEGIAFDIKASKYGFLTLRVTTQATEIRLEKTGENKYSFNGDYITAEFVEEDGLDYMIFQQAGNSFATIKIE